ncbi:hypothetical protein [Accumulibacter sp.]
MLAERIDCRTRSRCTGCGLCRRRCPGAAA